MGGVLAASFVLATFSAGCKRPGAGAGAFRLAPISPAPESLIGTLVWPSVEGSLADLGGVAKKLGFPFSAEDVKASLLAQAPFQEATKQIDLARPITVVFLANPASAAVAKGASAGAATADAGAAGTDRAKDRPFSAVAAFALRPGGPTTVDGLAKLLGTVVERRQDAVAVRPTVAADAGAGADAGVTAGALVRAPEIVYAMMRDGAVLMADEWSSLEQGGALALAARGNGAKTPTLSLRPEGLARSQGTTLAAALRKGRAEIDKNMATRDGKDVSPMLKVMVASMLDLFFGWVESTEAVELGASLNDTHGLAFTVGLRPVSGSQLAKIAASVKPYVAEPALLAGEPPAFLAAGGEARLLQKQVLDIIAKALDAVPPDQGDQAKRDELHHLIEVAAQAWTGAGTIAFRFKGGFSYDIVYDVAPDQGKALVESMAKLVGPSPLGDLGAMDPALAGSTYVLEKDGDVFWGHLTSTESAENTKGKRTATAAQAAKASKDARRKRVAATTAKADTSGAVASPLAAYLTMLELRLAVDGGKMIATTGPDSKARLADLRAAVKAPAPPPHPRVAAVLEATKGAWFFESFDIGAMFQGAAEVAAKGMSGGAQAHAQMAAMAAMLGDAHLGLLADLRGGDTFAFTLHVPIDTATTVAMLVTRFTTGLGLNPGGPSPAPGALAAPPWKHRRP